MYIRKRERNKISLDNQKLQNKIYHPNVLKEPNNFSIATSDNCNRFPFPKKEKREKIY
jgi:hypothetical protein